MIVAQKFAPRQSLHFFFLSNDNVKVVAKKKRQKALVNIKGKDRNINLFKDILQK